MTNSTATVLLQPAELLGRLDEIIQAELGRFHKPYSLYEPMRYVLGGNAKRLRPLMVLLSYQAFDGAVAEPALRLAAGVEYFHNFTLVHDDIMDNAPTRRGQPTVHVKWNPNVAILSGDAIFAEAFRLVATSFPEKAAVLGERFAQVALEVCEGQAEDMDYTAVAEVGVDAYLDMIRKKTAVMVGGCLWLGAVAGGATPEEADALCDYGEQVGTAFQLMDDLLDTYADADALGKQVGGDIIEGKNTYLWLRALQKATPQQRKELAYWRGIKGMDAEKVRQTRRMYDLLGVEADTRELVQQYYSRANEALKPLLSRPGIQQLVAFMDGLVDRKK